MLTEKLFAISQGGAEIILWFLLFISIASIGLILERWYTLGQVSSRSEKTKDRIREALVANNLEDLEEISKDRDSLEGRALSYGLRYVKDSGTQGLGEIFNSFALIEKPNLERSLNFLATIGSNAPFLGLLGTVLGIMKAFRDLSQNTGSGNEAVMLGIAEALVSTAVGLVVAIPAVVAYNHFQKKVKTIFQSIETCRELCMAYAKRKGKI